MDEEKTNRDIFLERYAEVVKERFPEISEDLLNDCIHGSLIAINSEKGLSSFSFEAANRLGLEPMRQSIIDYVYEKGLIYDSE